MAKKKNNRKNNSKKIEEVVGTDTSLIDKLYIVGCVLIFILAFYGLTLYITGKNSDSKLEEEPKEVEISNDEIILGRSLSMGKGDYYVVYYNSDNTTMDEIVKNYKNIMPIYKVDMSSAFNKKYATEGESNKSPSKTSEFLINGPTLIKVSNKKVVEYYEGEDTIRTILN